MDCVAVFRMDGFEKTAVRPVERFLRKTKNTIHLIRPNHSVVLEIHHPASETGDMLRLGEAASQFLIEIEELHLVHSHFSNGFGQLIKKYESPKLR